MATLAVAIILSATTIPAYNSMIQRNEMTSSVNALVGELRYARSEALKRSASVTICPTADGAVCNGSGSPWMPQESPDHLIFVDSNGNGAFDASDDTVLKLSPATFGAVSVAATGGETFFSFSPKGVITVPNANMQYATSGSSSAQSCLTISLTGRSSVKSGACP
jgi:type IV fimbrial biogenesis protein FimT